MEDYKVVNKKDNSIILFKGTFTECTYFIKGSTWSGLGYLLCKIERL